MRSSEPLVLDQQILQAERFAKRRNAVLSPSPAVKPRQRPEPPTLITPFSTIQSSSVRKIAILRFHLSLPQHREVSNAALVLVADAKRRHIVAR